MSIQDNRNSKITDLESLIKEISVLRVDGRKIVLTNGAFDLLHVGHIRYLQAAARLGDVLVVAINDDESVQRLKGSDRPIFPHQERMEMVAALQVVDFVVGFGQDDVSNVIQAIQPEVHAKGTDYTPKSVPEKDQVAQYGGRVVVCGDPKRHSTTSILEKICKR